MPAMLTTLYPTMPWDAIDNVVFDVGNVLVVFDPVSMLSAMFPEDPLLRMRLMDAVFRSPFWVMLDRGSIDADEAAGLMAGRDTELLPPIQRLLEGWSDLTRPIPEGLAAMEAARAHGKHVYLLSNYHMPWFIRAQKRYPFLNEPYVDGMVISSPLHLMKPDQAIFRLLEQKYSLTAGRTVFIDDAAINVEGALNAGWQSIWFDKPGTLAGFMDFSF